MSVRVLVQLMAVVAAVCVLTATSAADSSPSRVLDLSKGRYTRDELKSGGLLKHGAADQWEALDLSDNHINEIDDNTFLGFDRLLRLSLASNSLGTIEDECFRGARHVAHLDLRNATLVAIRAAAFAGLDELRELNLADNLLRPFKVDTFKDNRKLTRLDLGNNPGAHWMFQNVTIPSLEELDVRKCRIANLAMVNFENMPGLKSINLTGNVVHRLDAGSLRTNGKLEVLDMRGNPLDELRANQLAETFAPGSHVVLHYDHDEDMCVDCDGACADDDAELQRYLCENPHTNGTSVYRGVYEWKNPAENTVITLMAH